MVLSMAVRDVFNPKVLLIGLILAFIYTFLQIYIELKVGFVVVTGLEVLGFILLSALGKKDSKSTVIVIVITTASVLVNVGVLVAFPAIAMFSHFPGIPGTEITPHLIFTMIALTGFCGLFLLEPVKDQFMDAPWPQIEAQVQNISALSEENAQAKRDMLTGLGTAGAYTVAMLLISNMTDYDLRNIPYGLGVTTVPPYIGVSNSPMLVGIGFFAGFKRTFLIFLGSLFSIFVWFVFERDPHIFFGEHITRPEIFYTAIGIVATSILLDAWQSYKEAKEVPVEEIIEEEREIEKVLLRKWNIKRFLKQWNFTFLSLAIFYIFSVLLFSVSNLFPNIYIHPILLFIGLPIAIVSAFFVAKSASETGLVIGFITDALAVPAVLFFSIDFPSVIIFMTIMSAIQSAAVTLLGRYVLGRRLGVDDNTVRAAAILGTAFGVFIGTWIIYTFSRPPFGFGTHEFPAPTAQLMGFTVLGLMELTSLSLPFANSYGVPYLILFLAVGVMLSIIVHKRNISPINLAVGLLIPPAYSLPLLIGGLLARHASKATEETLFRYKQILSGIVAGEGIVIALQIIGMAALDFFL